MIKCDVLVIGAGGAGLVSAIHAHKSGAKVVVITKEYATRSQTCMAQSGINAAFGNAGDDNVQAHIQNTLKSAHGLANEEAVSFLCENAKESVEWLDNLGVCFSRTKDAKIAQRKMGGASASRACYAQDYTGLKILHTLYDVCLGLGIEVLNERYLLDVCVDANGVSGANILNIRSGIQECYQSKSVIIATGGYSRIYDKNSTNSTSTTGDGIACAVRAGAEVSDMEFVQFHPTALKNSSILISESARGAGGYILNSKNERFIDELLPRDEVARAINDEIAKGENVFLDIRHLGAEFIDTELPQERKLAKFYEDVDPVYDLIPIRPAAHYTMGGISVDKNSMTNIKGLFAVGECANHKVHGANRLGGNSLLELIVFGKQTGENAAKYIKGTPFSKEHKNEIYLDYFCKKADVDFYEVKEKLGNCFYKNVGISRDSLGLKEAFDDVQKYISQLSKMGVEDNSLTYNTNLVEFLEFKNMLELASLILLGAIDRKESRGAHFRADFPYEDGAKK